METSRIQTLRSVLYVYMLEVRLYTYDTSRGINEFKNWSGIELARVISQASDNISGCMNKTAMVYGHFNHTLCTF